MRYIIIQTKICEIQESLSIVTDHLPNTYEEFKKLGLLKDGIYKKIEFCIKTIFDICAIINTDLHVGIPEGDENIIDNLSEHHILSSPIAESLKDMKGFRNILVHRYDKINDETAFHILQENIDDFYQFIDRIEQFLKKQQETES